MKSHKAKIIMKRSQKKMKNLMVMIIKISSHMFHHNRVTRIHKMKRSVLDTDCVAALFVRKVRCLEVLEKILGKSYRTILLRPLLFG